jgi:NAD(P)H-flavin reductase/hemoglobin-like flavoprotein
MSEDALVLKESFARVEHVAEKVAAFFYARLFVENPDLRDLFPVVMDVQRSRLLGALVRVVQGLDSPVLLEQYLEELGHDHRKFGVRPEHYAAVGRALVAALREYSGADWTQEAEEAWVTRYGAVAEQMIAGAESAAGTPPWWWAEVVEHERPARDVALITVRPDRPYPYRAGQYLSLETPRRARLWRTYSIANAPRQDNLLTFHVRAVPGGWVSGALVRRTAAGDVLRLGPPTGSMRVEPGAGRNLVLIAGGTGLAPLKAIVEEMARWNSRRSVHLFFGARRAAELYEMSWLCRLSGRHPWLTVVGAVSQDREYPGRRGRISDVAADYLPWPDHDVLVSGSPAMIRATLGRLRARRVPMGRIRYDPFDG